MNRRILTLAAIAALATVTTVGHVAASITATDADPAPSELATITPKQAVPAAVIDALTGPQVLTVSLTGTGTGRVSSSPAGITCGTSCGASFTGTVTLTASAGTKSKFVGWSGDCTGSSTTCTIRMDAAHSATARFDLKKTSGGRPRR